MGALVLDSNFTSNFRFGAVFAMLLDLMSAQVDPDAALMLRVREGDRDAFALLVDRYKQPVMNLVARTLRDFTEAEDVAQHVFLQVYKSAHRYEVTAKFSTWIFTIARNLCLNEIRRRSRHRSTLRRLRCRRQPIRRLWKRPRRERKVYRRSLGIPGLALTEITTAGGVDRPAGRCGGEAR